MPPTTRPRLALEVLVPLASAMVPDPLVEPQVAASEEDPLVEFPVEALEVDQLEEPL